MELASAIIFGAVIGVLYGLAALGIVVVYRVSRVLNFALAGTAAITSYEAWSLTSAHWPYLLIVVASLASGAVLGGACFLLLSLAAGAGRLAVGIGTIGLLLAMQGATSLIWGTGEKVLPEPVRGTLKLGSISVAWFEVVAVGIALVAILLTFLLVYRTRLGLRMRAISAGPRTAELMGVNPRRTELWAWMLGGVAGSLAGLLVVPLFQLDQNFLTNFMLASFTAVVIGGFTSLGGVVVAGIGVSVVLNLLATYVSSTHNSTYSLILIAFVLFVRPSGLFGRRELEVSEPAMPSAQRRVTIGRLIRRPLAIAAKRRRPTTARTAGFGGRAISPSYALLLVLVGAALIYGLVDGGTTAYEFATAFAMFIAVLGVGGIAGLSGQVSLGQGAFVALGAYSSGVVSVHLHASVWLGLPLAVIVGGLVGLVIGWPAARLSGVYLIVFTLAFGLAVPELLEDNPGFTGGGNGLTVNTPSFLQNSRYEYLVAGGVAAVAALCYALARRSQLGRRWRAVQDSEIGVSSIGWSPTVNKVTAFAFGSALTALGGALSGILVGYVSPDGYSIFLSIYLVVAVIVGGSATILGSLVGALVITLLPYYDSGSSAPQVIFGVALVAILIMAPEGLANRLMRGRAASATRGETQSGATSAVPVGSTASIEVTNPRTEAPRPTTDVTVAEPVLQVDGLTVTYAGGPALFDMSLQVGRGDAVAVVGANGAGKSTLLRAISGWVPAQTGHVILDGEEIVGRPAFEVARLGVAHVPEGRCVFPDLTVGENLQLGYRGTADRSESSLLEGVLQIFPALKPRLGQPAGTLSGGEQQMLAVGRGLMSDPRVLLLDEPSLGLAPVVIDGMFRAFGAITAAGVSILLVEQNVQAALRFAQHGYMLSRGECVMAGSSQQLASRDDLLATFLGQA